MNFREVGREGRREKESLTLSVDRSSEFGVTTRSKLKRPLFCFYFYFYFFQS